MKQATVIVEELMDAGIWDAVCELKGYDRFAVKEGKMSETTEIELDEFDCSTLNLTIVRR